MNMLPSDFFMFDLVSYRGTNRARHDQRCVVYRVFDSADRLLYVGHTTNLRSRMYQHRTRGRRAVWIDEMARVDEMWFDDVDQALDEESHAIACEGPAYNRAGSYVNARRRSPQQLAAERESRS